MLNAMLAWYNCLQQRLRGKGGSTKRIDMPCIDIRAVTNQLLVYAKIQNIENGRLLIVVKNC